MDQDASRLDEQDMTFEEDRTQEAINEIDSEERKPFEGMREYAESTMQELLAIYGLTGGDLTKSVSGQLLPAFLNPSTGQPQGEHKIPFSSRAGYSNTYRKVVDKNAPLRGSIYQAHWKPFGWDGTEFKTNAHICHNFIDDV